LDDVGAPLVAASFHQCTLPDTNSSILGLFGASLVAASFHLRAMTGTNSSLLVTYLPLPFTLQRRAIFFVVAIVVIGGGHIFQPLLTTHFLVGWPERRHHQLPLFSFVNY